MRELDELHTLLVRPSAGWSPVVVVDGGPGQGCTTLVDAARERLAGTVPVVQVRCAHPATGVGVAAVYRFEPDGGPPLREEVRLDGALELADRFVAGRPCVVLVDEAQTLDGARSRDLVARILRWRASGVAVCVALHGGGGDGEVTTILSSVAEAHWLPLGRLDDEQIWALVREGDPELPADVDPFRGRILALSQGIPGLAVELRNRLRRAVHDDGRCDESTVALAGQTALQAFALPRLPASDRLLLSLTVLLAMIWPEGSVVTACSLLGLSPALAPRFREALEMLGLLTPVEEVRPIVRRAVVGAADDALLASIAPMALDFLDRRRVSASRLFELLDLLGRRDARYFETGRRAVEEARARGDCRGLTRVADSLLVSAADPQEAGWARRALLEHALRHDWQDATTVWLRGEHPDVVDGALLAAGPSEFALEAPVAARTLAARCAPTPTYAGGQPTRGAAPGDGGAQDARTSAVALRLRLLAGERVGIATMAAALRADGRAGANGDGGADEQVARLAALTALAFRGASVERRVQHEAIRLKHDGTTLRLCGHAAALLGACHLALADHDAAVSWARVAMYSTAARGDASRALGHLVAAQAEIRRDRYAEAADLAAEAESMFRSLNARWLTAVAQATGAHARLESRRQSAGPLAGEIGVTWAERPAVEPGHPLVAAYLVYVGARVRLAAGDVRPALDGFFETGRVLRAAGLDNPTLLHWRQHLVTVFQARGESFFVDPLTADLADATLRWSRRNPRAGQRHARRLLDGSAWPTPPDVTAAVPEDAADPPPDVDDPAPDALDPTGVVPLPDGVEAAISPAEIRVVREILQGRTNVEVARRLYLSKRTVDTHLSNVYRKLGIHSRQELVRALSGIRPPSTDGP